MPKSTFFLESAFFSVQIGEIRYNINILFYFSVLRKEIIDDVWIFTKTNEQKDDHGGNCFSIKNQSRTHKKI